MATEVVQAVKASSLKKYVINLMTMDFGSASAGVCVVVSGACEMGQSSIQAVTNLEHTYGIAAGKIAVTPMIGLNDNTAETFTAADVDTLTTTRRATASPGCTSGHWTETRPALRPRRTPPPPATRFPARQALQYTNRFLTDLGI